MQKLLTLGPQDIQTSVYPGVSEAAVPLWAEGRNLTYREMGLKKLRGGALAAEYQGAPWAVGAGARALLQSFVAGKRRLYAADNTNVWYLEYNADGTHTVNWISPATALTASADIGLETWGTWLVFTNGVNKVKVWKNGGQLVDLAGQPFNWAKIIKRKSPYLLAFNTSNGDTMAEWSHTSDIENWTISASTEAGNMNIRDLESGIVAVTDLGDRIGIYSRSSLVLGTYLGRPNVFGFRRVLGGIGAVSARSVVSQGAYNYGLNTNGVFKTDGNDYAWIDDPIAQKWIIDNVDWTKPGDIHGYHDDYLRMIHWYFTDKAAVPRSISFHYDSGQFIPGDLNIKAAAPRNSFEVPIVAGGSARLYYWQQGDLLDNVRPAHYLRTKPLDFGSRDYAKILNMVRVDGIWGLDTKFRVGALSDAEGQPEWFHDGTLKRDNYFADEREDCYFVIEFSGTADFLITGIEFFGVPGGLLL